MGQKFAESLQGFTNPTKTDRRFFQTRLRELIAQGVIERVMVPSSKVKSRYVKCIRLVTPDNNLPEGGVVLAPNEGEEDEKDIAFDDASGARDRSPVDRSDQLLSWSHRGEGKSHDPKTSIGCARRSRVCWQNSQRRSPHSVPGQYFDAIHRKSAKPSAILINAPLSFC